MYTISISIIHSSLGLLSSAKLHFGNNELLIHSTEASNCAFVIMHYRTPIETPISIAIDLNNIKGIKADEIQIYTSNNQLIFNDDGLMYKCAALSDPNVDKRDREGPAVKWDHVNLALTNAHVKKVLTMINAKNKYNFDFSDNVLTINDATDNAMEYIIEVEGSGTFHTQVHGMYLVDVFMAPKYFTGYVITLGNNTPFKVSYACEWLTLDYFVAPMIEQD